MYMIKVSSKRNSAVIQEAKDKLIDGAWYLAVKLMIRKKIYGKIIHKFQPFKILFQLDASPAIINDSIIANSKDIISINWYLLLDIFVIMALNGLVRGSPAQPPGYV